MSVVTFVEGDVPDHLLVFPTLNTKELNKYKIGEITYSPFFDSYCFTPVHPNAFPAFCDMALTSDELEAIATKLRELNKEGDEE